MGEDYIERPPERSKSQCRSSKRLGIREPMQSMAQNRYDWRDVPVNFWPSLKRTDQTLLT